LQPNRDKGMGAVIGEIRGHASVAAYLIYIAKWVVAGYLWDIARLAGYAYCCTPGADPDGSIGKQRLKWIIWRDTQRAKIEWRDLDNSWSGIRSLWRWYWEGIVLQCLVWRLERKLRPIMAQYGTPGQSCMEFVATLPALMERAGDIQAAAVDREPMNRAELVGNSETERPR